jgi:hypothetical protein
MLESRRHSLAAGNILINKVSDGTAAALAEGPWLIRTRQRRQALGVELQAVMLLRETL